MATPHYVTRRSQLPAGAHAMFTAGHGYYAGPHPAIQPPPPKPKSQSVSQVANQRVNQQLAPVLGAQDAQAASQNENIKSFALALLGKLQGGADQVGANYDKAIGQTAALSGATADALRNANPNQQDQQLLSAINAPDQQRAQVQSKLADTFGGGAAALQFTQGEVPGSMLAAQKASDQAQASKLPGIAALKGEQDLSSALAGQRQNRMQTLANRPGMVANETKDINANIGAKKQAAFEEYKFQTARADAYQAAGMKLEAQQARDKAAMAYKYASLNSQNQRAAASIQSQNARAAASIQSQNARTAAQIEAANNRAQIAAKKAGVKTTGKGALTQKQTSDMIDKWKNGKVQSAQVAQTDGNGNVVRDSNGAVVYKGQSGTTGQLTFEQAYKRLRQFGKTDVQARKLLDTAYKRGEQGRAWVSNEEQAALSRAKQPPRAKVITGKDGQKHGLLTQAQYLALKKAGKVPPGQLTAEGIYVIAQVY